MAGRRVIDGPQDFGKECRKNRLGKPSFASKSDGINLLKNMGWNGRDGGGEYQNGNATIP